METARIIDSRRILDPVKFRFYNEWLYNSHINSSKTPTLDRSQIQTLAEEYFIPFNLPFTARIVDIACKQGYFLDITQGLGYDNTVGITLRPDYRDLAQSRGHIIESWDYNFLPQHQGFEDETVDYVWACHALEHSPYPLFTLIEMNRIMRCGAHIFIQTPQPNQSAWENDTNVYSVLGKNQLEQLLNRTGFVIEKFTQAEDSWGAVYRILAKKTVFLDIK